MYATLTKRAGFGMPLFLSVTFLQALLGLFAFSQALFRLPKLIYENNMTNLQEDAANKLHDCSWLAKLFNDETSSDVLVTCNGSSIRAHKAILSAQSQWFHQACYNEKFREAAENVINLPKDEPNTVEALIRFFYEGTYSDAIKPNDHAAILFHAKIYAMAEMYNVQALKPVALAKFEAAVVDEWAYPGFAETVQYIYESVPYGDRRMKEVVASSAYQHLEDVFEQPSEREILENVSEFMADLKLKQQRAHISEKNDLISQLQELKDEVSDLNYKISCLNDKVQKKNNHLGSNHRTLEGLSQISCNECGYIWHWSNVLNEMYSDDLECPSQDCGAKGNFDVGGNFYVESPWVWNQDFD